MREIPATEFTRNFGFYSDVAQHEPVAVTTHGRPTGYFISNVEFDMLQRLKARAGRAIAVQELSEAEILLIAETRMSPEHDGLNALLDEQ